jgi:hypothetical protein
MLSCTTQQMSTSFEKSGIGPEMARLRAVTNPESAAPPTAAVATKPGKQRKARALSRTSGLQGERGGGLAR